MIRDRRRGLWASPRALLAALCLGLIALQALAQDDPPGRVGRLADLAGPVSLYDQDEGRWVEAFRNRPLTGGDRVSTGREARAEVRIGSVLLRLSEATEVELLRLDDNMVRVQLHRGTLALRVRSRELAAETEVITREVGMRPQRAGLFRIERFDDTTAVSSWRGEMRVLGEPPFEVEAGRRVEMWREGPARALAVKWTRPLDDAFAAWVAREDRSDERGVAATYLSSETTGIEDLDRFGRWEQHPEYGAVWLPLAVQSDWVPYRNGHWAWVRPWGWTWIEDAAWGFAPFHYGRWISWNGRWCWTPGRFVARPVFAPALVAWSGGWHPGLASRFDRPTSGWMPLAPTEPYRPHYRVSPGYQERVNQPWPHLVDRRPPGAGLTPPALRPGVPHTPFEGNVTTPARPDRRVQPPPGGGDPRDDGWRRAPRPRSPDWAGSAPGHVLPGQPTLPDPRPARRDDNRGDGPPHRGWPGPDRQRGDPAPTLPAPVQAPQGRHERGQGVLPQPALVPPVPVVVPPAQLQSPARPPVARHPVGPEVRPGPAPERDHPAPRDEGKSRSPEQRQPGRDRQAQQ